MNSNPNIRIENQEFIDWFYSLVNSWTNEQELFEKIIDIMDPIREVFAKDTKSI